MFAEAAQNLGVIPVKEPSSLCLSASLDRELTTLENPRGVPSVFQGLLAEAAPLLLSDSRAPGCHSLN